MGMASRLQSGEETIPLLSGFVLFSLFHILYGFLSHKKALTVIRDRHRWPLRLNHTTKICKGEIRRSHCEVEFIHETGKEGGGGGGGIGNPFHCGASHMLLLLNIALNSSSN